MSANQTYPWTEADGEYKTREHVMSRWTHKKYLPPDGGIADRFGHCLGSPIFPFGHP
jgi:hypothetical protein